MLDGDDVGTGSVKFDRDRYNHVTTTMGYLTCKSFHKHDAVRLDIGWSNGDAVAVDMKISSPDWTPHNVVWTVGRNLMYKGVCQGVPAGHSDVKISENPASRELTKEGLSRYVIFEFTSLDGSFMLSVSRTVVARFVRITYEMCPLDRENQLVEQSVERLIASLQRGK